MSCEVIIPSSDPNEQQEALKLPEDKLSDQELSEPFVNNYFSHCNVLSKGIISEQKSLAKFLGEKWRELDYIKKDSLLDLLFVENDVRQVAPVSRHADEQDIPESFPRLYVNAGQKINVDYENDLWTWRDEHSGPFSWMSRSQQDLTLVDIESENVLKPQPKTLRLDLENPENEKKPDQQFTFPANCWARDIIDDFRTDEKSITISPCTSIEFSNSLSRNIPETKEKAIEEIQEDVTPKESSNQSNGDPEGVNGIEESTQRRNNSGKERRKRSPSPKKMLRSSSLKRSPSKASDGGEQQLISDDSKDNYKEMNAFSNPVVETEWSSFVNENGRESNGNASVAPKSQVMDRGGEMIGSSPYQVQRDKVHLISPSESPAQSGKTYAATNDLGGWSSESTPDHTTHLLKGMESDGVKKQEYSAPQISSQELSCLDKQDDEDEVLTIENFGTDFTISTTTEPKRESSIPTTGFDFLDNW